MSSYRPLSKWRHINIVLFTTISLSGLVLKLKLLYFSQANEARMANYHTYTRIYYCQTPKTVNT